MTLGELLKQKRTEQGLSQRKIAELLNVYYQHYQQWEMCIRSPSAENMIKLMKELNITIDELFSLDFNK